MSKIHVLQVACRKVARKVGAWLSLYRRWLLAIPGVLSIKLELIATVTNKIMV